MVNPITVVWAAEYRNGNTTATDTKKGRKTMKRIECDICREPQIDRCEWHWEIKKKCFHTGDKRKIHICARCATAIIDVVMEKRKTYDAAPVCGED